MTRKRSSATEAAAAERRPAPKTVMGLDWFAFVVSFKGVLLEGLEVVFIVLTFGSHRWQRSRWRRRVPRSPGAIVLASRGGSSHKPLSRVPENTIKHGVGILLTTFRDVLGGRGLALFAPGGRDLEWPGGELAIVVVLVAWLAVSRALVFTLAFGA